MLAVIITVMFLGLITGMFVMASAESTDDGNEWAYEYEITVKPDCFTRSETRRGSCDGAKCICDFVSNDCTTCPYWRGKV